MELYGSPRLDRVYESLLGELHLCMIQSRHALGRERIVREHAHVLMHIRSGAVEDATEAMRAHLEGACLALAESIGRGP